MHIAIWGAGEKGEYLVKNCREDIKIINFIDNNKEIHGEWISGIKVVSPKEILRDSIKDIDGVVLSVTDMGNVTAILQQLRNMGLKNIAVFKYGISLKKNVDWDELYWLQDISKPILPYLETNIIDICNLNCKGCTHFSNLFRAEKDYEYKLEGFKRDISQIADSVEVLQLRLLGGEPLLNKRVLDYIKIARKIFPNTDIHLVSNGLLVPKQTESFFHCLEDERITLDISLYPPTAKIKGMLLETLEKTCIDYNISLEIKEFYRTLNINGNSNGKIAYKNCCQKHCNFLRAGKLYKCPYEGLLEYYIKYFDLSNIIIAKDKGIDIYDATIKWSDAIYLLEEPIDLCKYCAEESVDFFPWEVEINPQREDWLKNL